jgi:hypothetical protein
MVIQTRSALNLVMPRLDYVPPRYRVQLSGNFKLEQPAQIEVHLSPTGLFGIQDGRTLRRAEDGQHVLFDQKTGEFVVAGSDGKPITLDPVSLENLSFRIGQPVNALYSSESRCSRGMEKDPASVMQD